MPSTVVGSGIPASAGIVGATSIRWVNCERRHPCPGPRWASERRVDCGCRPNASRPACSVGTGCFLPRPERPNSAGPSLARRAGRARRTARKVAVAFHPRAGGRFERPGDRAFHAGAVVTPDPHGIREVVRVVLVVTLGRSADDLLVLGQARVPLARTATGETVEVVKAPPVGPTVELARGTLLAVRCQMPLSDSCCAVAVVTRNSRKRGAIPGECGAVAGEAAGELADRSETHHRPQGQPAPQARSRNSQGTLPDEPGS